MSGVSVDEFGEAFVVLDNYGNGLSAREQEVLRNAADGLTNAEIGRRLFLSEHTVKTYLRRVLRRLDAKDRTHAVHLAWRRGLLR
jgi:DNA-binding CsgD family transcriptional regulator